MNAFEKTFHCFDLCSVIGKRLLEKLVNFNYYSVETCKEITSGRAENSSKWRQFTRSLQYYTLLVNQGIPFDSETRHLQNSSQTAICCSNIDQILKLLSVKKTWEFEKHTLQLHSCGQVSGYE